MMLQMATMNNIQSIPSTPRSLLSMIVLSTHLYKAYTYKEAAVTKAKSNYSFDSFLYNWPLSRCTRSAQYCGFVSTRPKNTGTYWRLNAVFNKTKHPTSNAVRRHECSKSLEQSFADQYRRVAAFLDEQTKGGWNIVVFTAGVADFYQIYAVDHQKLHFQAVHHGEFFIYQECP